MKVPEAAKARRGGWIQPAWEELIRFIESTGVIVESPNIQVEQGANGTRVYAPDNFRPWQHPFRVRVGVGIATIREGTVNNISPRIEGVRINGKDDDGESVDVPPLELKAPSGKESFIAIQVNVTEADPVQVLDTPEALTVVHVERLTIDGASGAPVVEGVALQPIARLEWDPESKLVTRTFQIVHHNLEHSYSPNSEGARARHFFWAV